MAGAINAITVGVVAGAQGSGLIQYALIGATLGIALLLIAIHPIVEAFLRPVRLAIAGDTGIGDSMPRSRPSFATWSSISILSIAWAFSFAGAALGAVIARTADDPVIGIVIATFLTLVFALPITVGALMAPSLRPIRDLAEGTERVAAGDYSQRLPVVQDDDLGALAGSFNRMQAGLAERERLQAAFGSYVDPALATRLLEQGDDIFTGERIDVTVLFVDIRDFTPFAESHTAEDTVSHLNALFEIVVPAVLDAGGHVNKYLGDGALAVFGAPNTLDRHADAAVTAAVRISRLVAKRFKGELRIGIGINTGQGDRRHHRRGRQARVHPHRRRRQRRRAHRAAHEDDGRHHPADPGHPRCPRQETRQPHRSGSARGEGQVGDRPRSRPRTGGRVLG